jgi:hypothetical protein
MGINVKTYIYPERKFSPHSCIKYGKLKKYLPQQNYKFLIFKNVWPETILNEHLWQMAKEEPKSNRLFTSDRDTCSQLEPSGTM